MTETAINEALAKWLTAQHQEDRFFMRDGHLHYGYKRLGKPPKNLYGTGFSHRAPFTESLDSVAMIEERLTPAQQDAYVRLLGGPHSRPLSLLKSCTFAAPETRAAALCSVLNLQEPQTP